MDVRKPPADFGERHYIQRMTQMHYALFDTVIGTAGIAWGEAGLIGVHLPERDAENNRRSFQRRFPGIAEAEIPDALMPTVEGIRALMRGEKVDLTKAPLDIGRVPAFNAKVYAIARAIPPGETMTYGEIATRLGDRLLARDVGAAMGANPWPILVPCHRVTAAGGKPGGFSARGGVNTKLKLLAIEGAAVVQPPAPKPKAAPAPQGDLFG
jgi:methylated-DNA-[protein]-cysteine S-methyltransferase